MNTERAAPPVPEPDVPAPRARLHCAAVCGLALAAWLLNLYFYTGYYMSDDMSYLQGIQRLARLEPLDPTNIAHMRLALVAPAALVYRLFGSVTLTILTYTLYHPLLVLIAYAVGRLAFQPAAGLLGAAILAISPLFYVYGGAILPDNCLAVWLAITLLIATWTLRQTHAGKLSKRIELACWLGAGVATGVAYSAKESGIVVAVPVALTILGVRLRDGARWHALASAVVYGLGVVAFVALETVLVRMMSGTWIVRLLGGVGNAENVEALMRRTRQQGVWPLDRLRFWYGRSHEFFGFGLVILVLANLAALPLLGRRAGRPSARRYVVLLLAFWVWLFLYLCLGTTNFSIYLPPPIQHPRYFGVCFVPAALVTAAVLWRLTELLTEGLAGRVRWPRLAPALLAGRAWWPRLAPALLALLVVLWALPLFLYFEPNAGLVYRAAQTKAALAAFEDGRRLYPKRPIVLSTYLARRLAPLLEAQGCTACGRIVTRVDTPEELPERPFVALIADKSYKDNFGPVIKRLERQKQLTLEPIGHGTYRSPYGRRNELRAVLYPLLGEFSEPDWQLTKKDRSVRLYLVSDSPAVGAAQ